MAYQEINRYNTKSDASGETHIVVEYQNMLAANVGGRIQRTKGSLAYQLTDGRNVNWIDDETFQIVQTDEIIRKIG